MSQTTLLMRRLPSGFCHPGYIMWFALLMGCGLSPPLRPTSHARAAALGGMQTASALGLHKWLCASPRLRDAALLTPDPLPAPAATPSRRGTRARPSSSRRPRSAARSTTSCTSRSPTSRCGSSSTWPSFSTRTRARPRSTSSTAAPPGCARLCLSPSL